MVIRRGSKEVEIIKEIQRIVGVEPDGVYGSKTESAVIYWQRQHLLVADGVVGSKTLEAMGILDTDTQAQFFTTESGLTVHRHFLPKDEYITAQHNMEYLFLHHTAGWDNPYKVIDNWGRDRRGKIGTEFVIGGQKVTDGSDKHDGVTLQCMPAGSYGWHLGKVNSKHMHTHSVGIEVCSFGYLDNGKTYVGQKAHESQIAEVDYRGHDKWHKYSDAQLTSLQKLIEFIAERDSIDIREGLPQWIRDHGPAKAFEFNQDACDGRVKGLLTHTNVRTDKTDMFPQVELVDMLLSL